MYCAFHFSGFAALYIGTYQSYERSHLPGRSVQKLPYKFPPRNSQ
nr:hypothetical protein [Escherichia coli]